VEIAETILHECIHAYLFVKANYPATGVDFVKILNSIYPNYKEQHDFMYDHMIPTMQKVLSEIRDLVTTAVRRDYVSDLNVSPITSEKIIWNWNDFYKNLSINGLQETNSFNLDFPLVSKQFGVFKSYNEKGKLYLDK
jgi:hypothetical protein